MINGNKFVSEETLKQILILQTKPHFIINTSIHYQKQKHLIAQYQTNS